MKRPIKFEYGFESVNGVIKKVYELHEIPNIKEKCDVWGALPIKYVRQFTGLTDKNGREIYEGDIVRAKTVYHSVFNKNDSLFSIGSQNGTFVFVNIKGSIERQWSDGNNEWYSIENIETFEIEIIGNIHENPELLTA
jgi:uncharacterized phage protein (TIGR01671 family)